MTTITNQTQPSGRQLEITWVDGDEKPAGDLIGRTAGFYPSKRIGPLLGTITGINDYAYIVKVTGAQNKAGCQQIGKTWVCAKETTAIMLF